MVLLLQGYYKPNCYEHNYVHTFWCCYIFFSILNTTSRLVNIQNKHKISQFIFYFCAKKCPELREKGVICSQYCFNTSLQEKQSRRNLVLLHTLHSLSNKESSKLPHVYYCSTCPRLLTQSRDQIIKWCSQYSG